MSSITHAAFDVTASADQPISMRVRFSGDPHWLELDEPSVHQLLQIPSDTDWRGVRKLFQLVGRFEYSVFEAGAVRDPGRGQRRRLSIAEKVLWDLLNTRTLETAGLTAELDRRTGRGRMFKLANTVRENLMAHRMEDGILDKEEGFLQELMLRDFNS